MKKREPDVTGNELIIGIVILTLMVGFIYSLANYKPTQITVNEIEGKEKLFVQAIDSNAKPVVTEYTYFMDDCKKHESDYVCQNLWFQNQNNRNQANALDEQKRTERIDFWINFLHHR